MSKNQFASFSVPYLTIFFGGIGFYCEQIYDHNPWHPHHQNVQRIIPQGDNVRVENYALKDPDLHTGAGQDLEILATVTSDCIELHEGCTIIFKR
ncbi:CpcT/CpeT family chromophore lyase [Okeania sp. SIO2C2]|uniref:CpcT/CpeT family chromophore lyase n=1 Tax=Okeania sp. SIO2C2 TaxID=2607787 RepID=UPI002579BB0C|nr:CpcT/CpeT family chromophore lyase [Okeania sp. SIO2C2]